MGRRIRLCVVSPLFHPELGGVGGQAVLQTSELINSGVELFVISRKMSGMPEFSLKPEITVHSIPAFRPDVHNLEDKSLTNFIISLSFSLTLAFKLFTMRKNYDIVHFHGASLPLIVSLPVLKLLGKKIIAKVLASRLGTEAGSLKGRYLFVGNMLSQLFKGVDSFVAISREIADGLKNDGIRTERIKRIPNFVDTKKFHPVGAEEKLRLKESLFRNMKTVFNATGRMVERKGINVLIGAFAKERVLVSSALLAIIGTGPEEGIIRKKVSDEGIEENVIFVGSTGDVDKYYQASDIFVLTSYAEGLPNSLLEAMACGLPVVASRIGGVVDVVEDGKSGILFEPGDIAGLSSVLMRLLGDRELRERLGSEAEKSILEHFSIDTVADSYIKLYQEILNG